MVLNFHQKYVSNDHCSGGQSLPKTRWNEETPLQKEGLDGGVVLVDVVAGSAFVAGVGVVLGVAEFAVVGVTGIDVSGVFVVGLDGVDLVDVGAVGFSVGLYVGGVGVVCVSCQLFC